MPASSTYRPQQQRTAFQSGSVGACNAGIRCTYEYSHNTTQTTYTQCNITSSASSAIHMNGRTYAPGLQRFLSPDPVLQSPANAQSHNRYAYCLNNPLRYTDPSGYTAAPLMEEIWSWARIMMDIHGADRIDFDVVGCGAGYSSLSYSIMGGDTHYTTLIYSVTVSPNRGGSGGGSNGGGWSPRGYNGMGETDSGGNGGSGWNRGRNGGGNSGGRNGGGNGVGGIRLIDRLDNANNIISPTTSALNLIGAAAEAANAGNVAKTAADLQVEKILGKVGKIGKGLGWAGVGLSVGINLVNLFNDFTPGNMAKLLMSGAIAATGLIPYAGPIISLGLTAYELDGGFDDFYKWIDLQFNEP